LASTVTGPISDLAGLSFNPRVEFWPLSTPYNSGNTNVVGPMKSVQAISGNFSQVLLAGTYRVKFPPTTNSFLIVVPNDNSTYSLSTLSSNVASVASITSTYFVTSNQFRVALTNNDTRAITFKNTVALYESQGEPSSATFSYDGNAVSIDKVFSATSFQGDGSSLTGISAGSSIAAGTNIVTVTNGSLVTVHGTANVTQSGLAAGSYAINGISVTNLISGKNEMALGATRFAAGKVMKADYTYPSFTNLLTVTIISESWSWASSGWQKQLEERLREQLGNGGEFALIVAPYKGSMPVPSWSTTTNGTWLDKEYYFEAQAPGGIGSYIAFTNLYCRYADVWYQPTASSTMDVYTNGVLSHTTSGASALATNLIIDFGELRTHTLCLTNAGNGMRVTALNALTGEPGVNVRSISFSGYQTSDFWTNVSYQSFLNHRQITNDCVLFRHGLNEYLSGGAAGIAGFETNLFRLATNIHTTFPVASVVLMSSPQIGTLSTAYVEEINTKVRRMVSTNSWMWYNDGLNNQWSATDGTTLGAWNGGDTQHYNERGYSAYANYICRDVFGFTPSSIRRRTIWLSALSAKSYAGGTVDAPSSPPITRPLYDINGNNTIVIFPQIQSGAPRQLVYEIPANIYDGATTFALTQYYLTTNIQPVNTYKEIAYVNMDDARRTVRTGASTSTYQQLLSGTNVFRVREVFSTTTKLSGSYYVALQAGVSSLTNSIWAMGIKLEAW
jgi:hypothetical protein